MPRSPLTSETVNSLAKYFGAMSDASYIERTWEISKVSSKQEVKAGLALNATNKQKIEANRQIQYSDPGLVNGSDPTVKVADLIHGNLSFSSFIQDFESNYPERLKSQFEFYKFNVETTGSNYTSKIEKSSDWKTDDGIYAINVMNPYLSPNTKDTGAAEIFANGMPTTELAKCVPYINIDIISTYKTEKTAPPMSLIGFLNPKNLSPVDLSMINSQKTQVKSEVKDLGAGYKTGIELFLMPQTLTNQGETNSTYVPVIDRMKPFMSLKSLTTSTKLNAGTISFTTAKLEIILHDRSRLRDIAAFVRPDLYATTFLDITYGWSHPDGNEGSENLFGKFLNSLKNETRYRVANSSFSFDETGQVNISISIQTVGSIDLFYTGIKDEDIDAARQVKELFRKLNARISAINQKQNASSIEDYDYIVSIQDPATMWKSLFDKDFIDKSTNILKNAKDTELKNLLSELINTQNIEKNKNEVKTTYADILNKVQKLNERGSLDKTISGKLTPQILKRLYSEDQDHSAEYFSYGDFFMNYVALPLKKKGLYDEIQVIFYPFNRLAGAVHDLPISCFPIITSRFNKVITQLSTQTPEITVRNILNITNERFVKFLADRSYLMADFYDEKAADEGESTKITKNIKGAEVDSNEGEKTIQEERCLSAGIPELQIKPAVLMIFVEASKMYDKYNNVIMKNGNPSTLLKIHVYDMALEQSPSLSKIIGAARDNELNTILMPIIDFKNNQDNTNKRDIAMEVLNIAIQNKQIEAISFDDKIINLLGKDSDAIKQSLQQCKILRLNEDFNQLKKIVSTGIPTITYGSSNSIITNANLSTDNSALSNLLLQRAFSEPASTSADNIGAGPPMQIIPATLSLSTIGFPLFSPMQSYFIDFGTGTSIDNIWIISSVDNKISKDGFTSDLKMLLGTAWAKSTSVNQSLMLMLHALNDQTTTPSVPSMSLPIPQENVVIKPPTLETYYIEWLHNILVRALVPVVEVQLEIEERIREEIEKIQLKVAAKIEEQKQKAIQKIEAAIPEKAKQAIATIEQKKVEVDYKIQQAQIIAAKIQYLVALAAMIPEIAAQIGPEAEKRLKEEIQSALADARAQAEENRRAENENG